MKHRERVFSLLLTLGLLLSGWTSVRAQQNISPEIVSYAEWVFHNGKVLTVDEKFTVAEAVAVRQGKILAVGENNRILRMAGPATRKVDLQGKTLIPGLVELHTGFFLTQGPGSPRGFDGPTVEFTTLEKGLEGIKKVAETKKAGEWVHIYSPNNTNVVRLTLDTLDTIVPNNPLFISPHSSNKAIINSQTLKLLPESIKTTPGYMTDKDGKFTGWLIGHASGVLRYEVVPWPDLDKLVPRQEQLLRYAASWGLTTLGGRFNGMSLSMVRKLQERGQLPVRVRAVLELQMNPNLEGLLKRVGNLTDLGNEWFRITGGTVVPPDSNINLGSAYTLKPKLGKMPRDTYGDHGMYAWAEITGSYDPSDWKKQEDWWRKNSDYTAVILANRYGWNITEIHSQGDGSFEELLRAFDEADKENPLAGRRFGAVHNSIRNTDQIQRAAKYDLQLSIGMAGLFLTKNTAEIQRVQYGADAVHRMLPVKSLIEAGLKPSLEHPFAAERYPNAYMALIEKLVTRENEQTGQVWGPDEKITREQALRMATIWPARYHKSENEVGSIEPGKLADLVVLGGDFLRVRDRDISEVPVLVTVVGGKVAYDRDGLLGDKLVPVGVELEEQ
ncbi:MAG: amidohydrolase family protein [Acidobacteria bacterium]|nr:amidohydrolase family protein [Acidobacteriota bacterium]